MIFEKWQKRWSINLIKNTLEAYILKLKASQFL